MPETTTMNTFNYRPFGGLQAEFQSVGSVPPLSNLKDGVYKVKAPGGHVHFLVQGVQQFESPAGVITIMFHGDLSNRAQIAPPFFAGRGVQVSVSNGPIVCFSDPIVEMEPGCSLAWFAGSEKLDVPYVISKVIDSLTGLDPRAVWLVGGSGGGYASINIACLVRRRVSVAVWNPQSAIERYNPAHVMNYLKSAFPDLASEYADASLTYICQEISRKTGRSFDLRTSILRGSAPEKILILQNYNDWHVIPHAAPLVEALGMVQQSPGIFSDLSGNSVGWFTELGHGHAAPETGQLVRLLRAIYRAGETKLCVTISCLDSAELFPASTYKLRPLDYRQYADSLRRLLALQLKPNLASVVSDYISEGQHRITYRFALTRGDVVIGKSGWKARMDWPMYRENEPRPGDVVVVDVRDGFGHTITRLSSLVRP